ncbi:MAG: ABC-F family ATP-binding cassette domain-containing protein, partial [Chloroflexi bacterium]|nr:ABC-F family ATP-binding cassette domain-containing protein [Chloroflexota bacterium]
MGRYELAIAGDQPIDAGKVNLSGVEKSRVALANVLAQPNNVLLLDEPANHLDTATREELTGAPGDYAGTIICAGHDLAVVDEIATHLYTVENGEITLTDVKDQAKCLRYSHPRYSGLTDSIGFTVTLWRGTSPVLMNWCRTPP